MRVSPIILVSVLLAQTPHLAPEQSTKWFGHIQLFTPLSWSAVLAKADFCQRAVPPMYSTVGKAWQSVGKCCRLAWNKVRDIDEISWRSYAWDLIILPPQPEGSTFQGPAQIKLQGRTKNAKNMLHFFGNKLAKVEKTKKYNSSLAAAPAVTLIDLRRHSTTALVQAQEQCQHC